MHINGKWKKSVRENEIYDRFERVNYQPEITVVSENCRKLMKFIRIVSVILWFIMIGIIFWGVFAFASYMLKAYWDMYEQI